MSFPIHIIDTFITFLKCPDFQADKLAYNSGLDILTGIAASRRAVALARSMNHSIDGQVSIPVPGIVVDLVAQELGQSASLSTSNWGFKSGEYVRCVVETEEQKALRNMCLVHRTWTIPTQRVFSSCVDVSGLSGLYHFLRSPELGPSTRMLRYKGDVDNLEMRHFLSAVIRMCPGLRYLEIDSLLELKHRQIFEDISNLQKLEILHLGHYDEELGKYPPPPLLLDVCQTLPRMKALK